MEITDSLIETATYILVGKQFILLSEEMPNIPDNKTGLARHIYVSSRQQNGTQVNHGPRIKVSNIRGKFDHKDNFSIAVTHEPHVIAGISKISSSELDDIYDWVKENHDGLHKLWNEEIDTKEFRKTHTKI